MDNMSNYEKKVANENMESNKSGEKQYEFITETIKKRPVNKKKIIGKTVLTIVLAIVFGVIASVTFAVVYPYVNEQLYPEQTVKVTLPVDEDIAEEPVEDFVPSEEEDDGDVVLEVNGQPDKADETSQKDEAAGETATNDIQEKNSQATEEKEVVVNQVVETIEKELELDDYRSLYRKLSSVGNTVLKSVVKVSGVNDATDWFSNKYEDNSTASGLIIADNGRELLIVSMTNVLNSAEEIQVTFCDGKTYKSVIKKTDPTTGLTIVAVDMSKIEESTMDKIEMATFGSQSGMLAGTPVLAVGSPQGISDSMTLGQITSSATIDKIDGSVRVLSTDIYGSDMASGVIANLNGRVLGFVCHEDLGQNMPNLIRAYSIIDLKDKIEKISNNQDLAMLGIIGTDVTEAAFNELGVPFGAYVKKVDIDSPAMDVGIRSGDVIVKFGTSEIKSLTDFKTSMLKSQPGDTVNITIMRPGKNDYTEITYEVTLKSL